MIQKIPRLSAKPSTAVFGFLFLLFFDRDRLQSDDYQIRKLELEIIQDKGGAIIGYESLKSISNPDAPKKPDAQENGTST